MARHRSSGRSQHKSKQGGTILATHAHVPHEENYDTLYKSYSRSNKNPYKSYDWRPQGRDGQSKTPASRKLCNASEMISQEPSKTLCTTRPAAGLLCRTPRIKENSTYKSLGIGPHTCSKGSSPQSSASCDYQLCDASEKYSSKVSSVHTTHERQPHFHKRLWQSEQDHLDSNPLAKNSICLRHNVCPPDMEAAGIITRNFEYPYPPEMHSIVRLDSYVRQLGPNKMIGQIVKDSFKPNPGDVLIMKFPRQHKMKDNGYVEFFTRLHEGCHLCPGDLLLRVGKFVRNNTWRYNKRFKLYQRTDEHHWLFIGIIDNFVNLLPLGTSSHGGNGHIDQHCRYFFPRRGDIVIHLQPLNGVSQLEWFNPKTKTTKGDILVRVYLGEPKSQTQVTLTEVIEGTIEIFFYSGKGLGWVFMGRDDCWFKDNVDLLD